jgi:uncharacterized protein YbbK (DUF523 family)
VPLAKILVSSCLLGAEVRYHGGSARIESPILRRWQEQGRVVGLCPEVAAGLGTPRSAAEAVRGDGAKVLSGAAAVMTSDGRNVTAAFVVGAEHAVAVAQELCIRVAVLKTGSPSCGTGEIYDGSFSGRLVTGTGVTAAALRRSGVRVFNELQLAEADEAINELDGHSVRESR